MSNIRTNLLKEMFPKQIFTHRVDWFSCLAFALLQYTPARPPNLIFYITCGRPQISLSKAACGRKAAGCAPLGYAYYVIKLRQHIGLETW